MSLRSLRPRLGLSVRITLTFALGALIVSAAVAASTYFFTVRFQIHEEEGSALRRAYVNAAIARGRLLGPEANVPRILDELTTGSTTNTVIYSDGRWFSSSLLVSRDALPAEIRTAALSGSVVRGWGEVRGAPEIFVGVPLPSARSAYFEVFDESALQRTLSLLRTVLVAAASATTAAGALLGWWVSRRLTAPLRAVASAARRIAGGDLATRLAPTADRELSDLVASFNAMVSALRGRIERDARFAADISHELRSPLTTLATSLSVLRARRDELSPRSRDALDLLTAELTRFQRLVDDLLEISRADADSDLRHPEPVRIAKLVLNMLGRPQYASMTASFDSTALDAEVTGDKRRLEQVMRNLLDNAAAYGGDVQQVRMETRGDCVVVHVDDNGPGVPAEDRERVFDRFARGRNAARGSHGGTGLGLALVREHVRAHDGSVRVSTSPEGGARFTVELPRRRA
jgi:two-component system, OmpR family, sensor histidine kinase MtrB